MNIRQHEHRVLTPADCISVVDDEQKVSFEISYVNSSEMIWLSCDSGTGIKGLQVPIEELVKLLDGFITKKLNRRQRARN